MVGIAAQCVGAMAGFMVQHQTAVIGGCTRKMPNIRGGQARKIALNGVQIQAVGWGKNGALHPWPIQIAGGQTQRAVGPDQIMGGLEPIEIIRCLRIRRVFELGVQIFVHLCRGIGAGGRVFGEQNMQVGVVA